MAASDLSRAEQRYRRLLVGLDAVDAVAALADADLERRQPRVSRWSVAQHLEHLAAADRVTCDWIDRLLNDPECGLPVAPKLVGRLILGLGYIPRGRGKAPRAVVPSGLPAAAVRALWATSAARWRGYGDRLPAIAACPAGFPHPYFGVLPLVEWLRFTPVHHHHHLKIVRDIRGAAAA